MLEFAGIYLFIGFSIWLTFFVSTASPKEFKEWPFFFGIVIGWIAILAIAIGLVLYDLSDRH